MAGRYKLTLLLENAKLPFLSISPNKVLQYLLKGPGSGERLRSEFAPHLNRSIVLYFMLAFTDLLLIASTCAVMTCCNRGRKVHFISSLSINGVNTVVLDPQGTWEV